MIARILAIHNLTLLLKKQQGVRGGLDQKAFSMIHLQRLQGAHA